MNFESYYNAIQRIKIMGSVMIGSLAIFWLYGIENHPNPIRRIFMFAVCFGSTAYALTLPLIWLAKHYQALFYIYRFGNKTEET